MHHELKFMYLLWMYLTYMLGPIGHVTTWNFLPSFLVEGNADLQYCQSYAAAPYFDTKVSFLGMCSKMQIIPIKNLNIKKVAPQFLWFFRLKCWFKGQIISRIHLSLPNAYKLMCFDRNINGNRDVKFFEWDYWSLHWRKNPTLQD